jgi:hypothetical protein
MTSRIEIPFPPPRSSPPGRVDPPMVAVEPRWEYQEVVRSLKEQGPLTQPELNALGDEHWELAGVVTAGERVHFYFKRARLT